ncbi:hypothetical protein [Pontibacter chinhatensis]|uniref:Lipoprotein n=1 Tax=Pontibacter chinhatensis TaxID=1436961 RepID=A0A1I2YNM5_9BACT|nr:hypothetical protein [Pontibacter chinhatensis]SFH27188.1 hypothetical protein SAMN05421739_10932 [Pontibacter chinhatensis]
MKTSDIVKSGLALAFASVVGFGCGNSATTEQEERDIGTSEAVVEGNDAAANLNNPRPAPIGDTAVTGEQADQFGDLPPNVDTAAREMQQLDKQRQQQQQRGTTTN